MARAGPMTGDRVRIPRARWRASCARPLRRNLPNMPAIPPRNVEIGRRAIWLLRASPMAPPFCALIPPVAVAIATMDDFNKFVKAGLYVQMVNTNSGGHSLATHGCLPREQAPLDYVARAYDV